MKRRFAIACCLVLLASSGCAKQSQETPGRAIPAVEPPARPAPEHPASPAQKKEPPSSLPARATKKSEPLPPFFTDKVRRIPDFMQTDPRADLPGGGKQFCAPVSVSNSLVELSARFPDLLRRRRGGVLDQRELIVLLSSSRYMNTSVENGTGASGLLRGIDGYLAERSLKPKRLEFQGWRMHPNEYGMGVDVPDLDWIKRGVLGDGAAWLNVGWYNYDLATNEYHRTGGHWVTLTGYDGHTLIIRDPSSRAGLSPQSEYVTTTPIRGGTLVGDKKGLPRSARGYLRLEGGMHVKKSADYAILDAAVVLQL